MTTKERPTPEQFLAAFPDEIQSIAEQLRQLIKQTNPNISEAVYLGWKLIGYREQDGRRSRYFCFVAPTAERVMLGFEYGVLMAKNPLLEGDGKQVRYVTLRDLADIRPRELSALIAEAAMVAASHARR
ncbi:MAG TPA: DUF1801 domain-containing protein [Roseiflexaceae bacterium]|nr:DUF1801 domain-containing protein [Roseiflexaceae bacterium]